MGDHSDALLLRIRQLEDTQAIIQKIAAYRPLADACHLEALDRFWADDAWYDMGEVGRLDGKDAIMGVYSQTMHQVLIEHGSGHIGSLPHVIVNEDDAEAFHYATLYRHRDGCFDMLRMVASRWTFRRYGAQGWKATSRTNRVLDGRQSARSLFAELGDRLLNSMVC